MDSRYIVSSSPHMRAKDTISSIMRDVIIALLPATFAGIYFFGYRALLVILTSVAASVLSEYLYQKIMKKPISTRDLSAVVTGLLLALNLPVTIPLWMVAIGAAFAIIVKQLYGGLGKNFMNPALAARCFMAISWAGCMTAFVNPFMGYGADAVSSATPLAVLKGISQDELPSLFNAFLGFKKAGCIGETSGAMLILGFLYLLIKKVVDFKIPVFYIASFAIFMYLFGSNNTEYSQVYFTLLHILTGGLLFGAFFMATDYVTTPTTPLGRVIFGVGCGFLTFAIRKFGSYTEGVSFSILIMNLVTPLIERFTIIKPFGEVKKDV